MSLNRILYLIFNVSMVVLFVNWAYEDAISKDIVVFCLDIFAIFFFTIETYKVSFTKEIEVES